MPRSRQNSTSSATNQAACYADGGVLGDRGLGIGLGAGVLDQHDGQQVADLAVAAGHAYLGQVGTRVGSVACGGATQWLPIVVGDKRAREMLFTNRRIPARLALDWGLVNRVYDDAALTEETMKLAHELANGPTIALSLIRKLYWDSPDNSFEDQLDLEFQSQRIAGAAEDFKEGVTAFLEKRPAKFKGK